MQRFFACFLNLKRRKKDTKDQFGNIFINLEYLSHSNFFFIFTVKRVKANEIVFILSSSNFARLKIGNLRDNVEHTRLV